MKIIGLTGGIASGKSTVSAHLGQRGARVIDADAISRALTAPGGEALPQIGNAFGAQVFDGEKLNRAALAQLVFSDPDARMRLNELMHPLILRNMQEQTRLAAQEGIGTVLWDVPLLFETGFDRLTNETWLVAAPERVQIQRLMARDGMNAQQALLRIRAQMPLAQKRALADYVLENDGTVAQLLKRADRLWERCNET